MQVSVCDHFRRRMPFSTAQFPETRAPTIEERKLFWRDMYRDTPFKSQTSHMEHVEVEGRDVVLYHGQDGTTRTVLETIH